ncbi:MAG: hypothetical protein ACI9YE_000394 [Psychroserpens sp.]|jgi:hypothetical protein
MSTITRVSAPKFLCQAAHLEQMQLHSFVGRAREEEYLAILSEHMETNCLHVSHPRATPDRKPKARRSPESVAQALKRNGQKQASKALAKARASRRRD